MINLDMFLYPPDHIDLRRSTTFVLPYNKAPFILGGDSLVSEGFEEGDKGYSTTVTYLSFTMPDDFVVYAINYAWSGYMQEYSAPTLQRRFFFERTVALNSNESFNSSALVYNFFQLHGGVYRAVGDTSSSGITPTAQVYSFFNIFKINKSKKRVCPTFAEGAFFKRKGSSISWEVNKTTSFFNRCVTLQGNSITVTEPALLLSLMRVPTSFGVAVTMYGYSFNAPKMRSPLPDYAPFIFPLSVGTAHSITVNDGDAFYLLPYE